MKEDDSEMSSKTRRHDVWDRINPTKAFLARSDPFLSYSLKSGPSPVHQWSSQFNIQDLGNQSQPLVWGGRSHLSLFDYKDANLLALGPLALVNIEVDDIDISNFHSRNDLRDCLVRAAGCFDPDYPALLPACEALLKQCNINIDEIADVIWALSQGADWKKSITTSLFSGDFRMAEELVFANDVNSKVHKAILDYCLLLGAVRLQLLALFLINWRKSERLQPEGWLQLDAGIRLTVDSPLLASTSYNLACGFARESERAALLGAYALRGEKKPRRLNGPDGRLVQSFRPKVENLIADKDMKVDNFGSIEERRALATEFERVGRDANALSAKLARIKAFRSEAVLLLAEEANIELRKPKLVALFRSWSAGMTMRSLMTAAVAEVVDINRAMRLALADGRQFFRPRDLSGKARPRSGLMADQSITEFMKQDAWICLRVGEWFIEDPDAESDSFAGNQQDDIALARAFLKKVHFEYCWKRPQPLHVRDGASYQELRLKQLYCQFGFFAPLVQGVHPHAFI